MYPCQRVMVSKAKKEEDKYTFHCKCVDITLEVSVEDNKPFPVPTQIKVIEGICEKRCPAIKRQQEAPAN